MRIYFVSGGTLIAISTAVSSTGTTLGFGVNIFCTVAVDIPVLE